MNYDLASETQIRFGLRLFTPYPSVVPPFWPVNVNLFLTSLRLLHCGLADAIVLETVYLLSQDLSQS